jgi:DNA-binding NarL/FixJ family response regulator
MAVAAEAADGQDALDQLAGMAVRGTLPDVILLDLLMPRMDGVLAVSLITGRDPAVRVVILTSFGEMERVHAALAAGAVGYLLKDASSDDVVAGIRAAARGESPLDPRAARTVLDAHAAPDPLAGFSPREREVLELLVDGLPNKLIARRLEISEKTVKSHMTRIFRKLGVTDRTQAALWAERHHRPRSH